MCNCSYFITFHISSEFSYLRIFTLFEDCKLTKIWASKIAKMAVLQLLDSSKLISRKIWMNEKSRNFHTVPLHTTCLEKVQRFCSYLKLFLSVFRMEVLKWNKANWPLKNVFGKLDSCPRRLNTRLNFRPYISNWMNLGPPLNKQKLKWPEKMSLGYIAFKLWLFL